jgi:sugar/nucleoside kinase (ribokinase family)
VTRGSGSDVVCLGILVADVIAGPVGEVARGAVTLMEEVTLHGGGCALNTATGLVRLGLSAAVVGKVGEDAFGHFLLGLLDERGIDRRAVLRDREAPTSATVVLVDAASERTFLHVPGANGALQVAELDPDLVFSGRALHVAGSLVMPSLDGEPTASLLAEARSRGMHTSLDTVYDATGQWARVEPCLPHVDLFAPSLAEAQAISEEAEPARAAAWLRRRGVRDVALTLGPEGSYVSGEGYEGLVPPVPVNAIDGTGAGDAFVAGLLYGRLSDWPLEDAARLGNAAGALATTAIGATEGLRGLEETMAAAGLEVAARERRLRSERCGLSAQDVPGQA